MMKPIIFSLTFISSVFLMGENVSLSQEENELEYQRRITLEHTKETYDLGGEISNYVWKNFEGFFPHLTFARTTPERKLEVNVKDEAANFKTTVGGKEVPLKTYVNTSPYVDGMVILKSGEIIYEAYPNMEPYERHVNWSVSKVITSTALASLEHLGRLDMDALLTDYLPEFKGSVWQDVSVRQAANMASGVDCLDSDGYQNISTCIYKLEESLGGVARKNPIVSTMDWLRSMKRLRPAGEVHQYVSANTYMISFVIEKITGQPFHIALQNLVWDKIGPEADGLIAISEEGIALVHSSISIRLRDVARFGEVFTTDGHMGIIGADHLEDLGSANGVGFMDRSKKSHKRRFGTDVPVRGAWQWDMIWPDGGMFKSGYSGQGLYVDPKRDLVIAWFGTHGLDGTHHELLKIARSFATKH